MANEVLNGEGLQHVFQLLEENRYPIYDGSTIDINEAVKPGVYNNVKQTTQSYNLPNGIYTIFVERTSKIYLGKYHLVTQTAYRDSSEGPIFKRCFLHTGKNGGFVTDKDVYSEAKVTGYNRFHQISVGFISENNAENSFPLYGSDNITDVESGQIAVVGGIRYDSGTGRVKSVYTRNITLNSGGGGSGNSNGICTYDGHYEPNKKDKVINPSYGTDEQKEFADEHDFKPITRIMYDAKGHITGYESYSINNLLKQFLNYYLNFDTKYFETSYSGSPGSIGERTITIKEGAIGGTGGGITPSYDILTTTEIKDIVNSIYS